MDSSTEPPGQNLPFQEIPGLVGIRMLGGTALVFCICSCSTQATPLRQAEPNERGPLPSTRRQSAGLINSLLELTCPLFTPHHDPKHEKCRIFQ